jgi:hypothetical protein
VHRRKAGCFHPQQWQPVRRQVLRQLAPDQLEVWRDQLSGCAAELNPSR